MQEILKAALDKAKISQELVIHLDEPFDHDEFQAIYNDLKTDKAIQTITINANYNTLSLESFAFITVAIFNSSTCNRLRLQNFHLSESLIGNLYFLSFKENFSISFEDVVVAEEIDGLATFLSNVKHISYCNLYESIPSSRFRFKPSTPLNQPDKTAASYNLDSLIGKNLMSLSLYQKTSKEELTSLPAIIPTLTELNIYDNEFLLENFYQLLQAIKINHNLKVLRLMNIEDEIDDSRTPGKEALETLMEIVKDHPSIEVFALDYPFCLIDELIVDFWEVLANKKTFVEVTLPYWDDADCRDKITELVKNSPRLKELNILSFTVTHHRARYMEVCKLTELNEDQEKEFGGYDQAQIEELKGLIMALHAHPTIIFINEEFIDNADILNICGTLGIDLHQDIERNKIIQGLSRGNKFAKVNEVKRIRLSEKLPTEFFANEEWQQRNVPPLKELCINTIQAILDRDKNQADVIKKLPEELVKEFSFK